MNKDNYFESGKPSFFNGRKKHAKCVSNYVDPYNSVAPKSGGSCRLTSGQYYEVVDEGTFYNSSNAFRTSFPMIFIKDDNENVWGLDEEMFDMEDEYSNKYSIELKMAEKDKATANVKLDESFTQDEEDDNEYEYKEARSAGMRKPQPRLTNSPKQNPSKKKTLSKFEIILIISFLLFLVLSGNFNFFK